MDNLEVCVVIGPMFSSELRQEISRLANDSHHTVTVSNSPETLVHEMLWCDLAIGTNGLTKYELAATATPALLFAINEDHDCVNRPFATMQTALDLGYHFSIDSIGREAHRLLQDVVLRASMATNGRSLIDGRGVDRVFMEIEKELFC